MMNRNGRPMLDAVLDVIYPRLDCVSCGKSLEKGAVHGLCGNCRECMPFIREPKCSLCGKPLEDAADPLCPDCRKYGHNFDQALSVFEFSESVRELIHRYKYDKEFSLNRTCCGNPAGKRNSSFPCPCTKTGGKPGGSTRRPCWGIIFPAATAFPAETIF